MSGKDILFLGFNALIVCWAVLLDSRGGRLKRELASSKARTRGAEKELRFRERQLADERVRSARLRALLAAQGVADPWATAAEHMTAQITASTRVPGPAMKDPPDHSWLQMDSVRKPWDTRDSVEVVSMTGRRFWVSTQPAERPFPHLPYAGDLEDHTSDKSPESPSV